MPSGDGPRWLSHTPVVHVRARVTCPSKDEKWSMYETRWVETREAVRAAAHAGGLDGAGKTREPASHGSGTAGDRRACTRHVRGQKDGQKSRLREALVSIKTPVLLGLMAAQGGNEVIAKLHLMKVEVDGWWGGKKKSDVPPLPHRSFSHVQEACKVNTLKDRYKVGRPTLDPASPLFLVSHHRHGQHAARRRPRRVGRQRLVGAARPEKRQDHLPPAAEPLQGGRAEPGQLRLPVRRDGLVRAAPRQGHPGTRATVRVASPLRYPSRHGLNIPRGGEAGSTSRATPSASSSSTYCCTASRRARSSAPSPSSPCSTSLSRTCGSTCLGARPTGSRSPTTRTRPTST